jgi:hypothetical protein
MSNQATAGRSRQAAIGPRSSVANRNEFRIVGMSRSGNHAVINWIMSQAQGPLCFLNCVEPKTNPFHSARPLARGGGAEDVYLTNMADFDFERERQGTFSHKDYLIYSLEDCFLGMVASREFEDNHDVFVGRSARRCDILILRDPFNLFASRLKSGYSQITLGTTARMWKQHAREFLGRRTYLTQERISLSYNAWVADREYRREIAHELGLSFTDAGFDTVAKTGDGSSFDGLRYDRRASEMKVFDRWQQFADDERYRSLFDAELLELSRTIFGPWPAAEAAVS